MLNEKKQNILEYDRDRLISWLESREIKPYRSDQILKWIYLRQADRFDLMTDIAKDVRILLDAHFTIDRLQYDVGTGKYYEKTVHANICSNSKTENGLKVFSYRSVIITHFVLPLRWAVLRTAGFV